MKNNTFRYLSLLVTISLLIFFFPVEQIIDAQGFDYFATENARYFEKIQSARKVADKKQSEDSKFSAKTNKADNPNESEINISAEPESDTTFNHIVTFKKSAENRQIYLALKDHEFKMLGSSAAKSFLLEGIDQEEFYEHNKNIIQSLEPDMKAKSIFGFEVVNDTLVGLQWAVEDLNLKEAWAFEQNENPITIAVIDTGIKADHDDFENTTILDGWNFVNDRIVNSDLLGHGTSVSGVIAATAGNFKGITGIAPHSKILPLQVFDSKDFAYESDIIEALYFAADSGSHIINMSYGGENFSDAENAAIQYALSKNCILIASAGNTEDSTLIYPASYDGVISVAAHDEYQDWADFSTHNSKVDFSAPGMDILTLSKMNSYEYVSGTSFSSPYIAGIAALALSIDYEISNAEFYNELINASIDLGAPGYDIYHGYGKIDTVKLLENLGGTIPVGNSSTWTDPTNFDISWYNPAKTTFEIETPQQLAGLSYLVNQGNTFKGKTIAQIEDIDLGGHNWIPIGFDYEHSFTYNTFQGTYDGNLHEITNMTIDIQLETNVQAGVGLFGRVSDGNIKNIVIGNGSSIKFLHNYEIYNNSFIGGIAGLAESDFTIENCHNRAVIYVSSRESYVGGIVGYSHAPVSNSTNSGDIISHNIRSYAGGIAGFNQSGIHNSYNNADIFGLGSSHANIGGIVSFNTGKISETYNAGNISGTSPNSTVVGGLAAILYGEADRTYNSGTIQGGSLFNKIGGIAGVVRGSSIIRDSTNYGFVYSSINSAFLGGIAGENSGKILNCQNAGGASASNGFMLYSGGIAGYNNGGRIENSINQELASVGSSKGEISYTGGIAAENTGEIINCSNKSFVVSSYSEITYLAGIAAINSFSPAIQKEKTGIIKNSFNTGYIWSIQSDIREEGQVIGGIAAYNDSRIENCYNQMNISDSSYILPGDGGLIAAYNLNYEDEYGNVLSEGSIINSYFPIGISTFPTGRHEGIVRGCGYFDSSFNLIPVLDNQIVSGKTELTEALNAGISSGMTSWVTHPEIGIYFPVNFVNVTNVNILGSPLVSVGFYSEMEALIGPLEATSKDIFWTIENITGIATVDQTGRVNGIKPGIIKVRATCAGSGYAFAEKEITIVDKPVIIFDTGRGTKIPDIIQDPGSLITIPADPQRTGYSFTGWDRPIPEIMPSDSMIITAIWEINKYNVTFKDWNGNILKSMEVDFESSAIAPANPNRIGFTFVGWDVSFNKITSNLTVTALYKENITGLLLITGTVKFNETINADRSGIIPAISGVSYQWRRNGSSISGATNKSYKIVQADIGQQISVKATGTGDYSGSVTSASIIPTKADTATLPTKPVLLSKTTDKIVVNTVSGHEYRLNNGSWQASGTFSGLIQDTSYKIYSRLAQTGTHLASAASQGLDVKTNPALISTSRYYISRAKNFVSKITLNETIKNFLGGILNNTVTKVFKGSAEIKDSDLVATGMKLRQYSGNTITDELTIIVTGDLTGNGNVGLSDFVKMKSHLLGKTTLTGEFAAAADVSGDGKISLSDYIKLKAHLLGKDEITPKEHE